MASVSRSALNDSDQRALVAALATVARGEGRGLTDLYRLTSAKLFGICLRICRNHQAAEDALNEVYLNVWRRADAFDATRGRPMTWLCTLARNRSIDWVRSYGRPTESDDMLAGLASEEPDAEQRLVDKDEARRLHLCLDALKPEQREAIRTAFFEGVTYAELASRQRVALGTMKTWVRRGLMKLKDCLHGEP
jgi:RNA polymerase sigma-70 factor (ECF subfamily)